MRVLLKEGAAEATAATILVFLRPTGATLETLSGESVTRGILAEADPKVVGAAASSATEERELRPNDLLKELEWLDTFLAGHDLGAKIELEVSDDGYMLDEIESGDSQ